ncbi:MAG: head-tail connector protein [Rickettsiales bacterium]|jgi:hypothetical protein|nr:head-tail connector protein [Rickettsiales bacterium]
MNNKKILQLYKKAMDLRAPWIGRWDQCRKYTLPASETEAAALFDSTAGDAAEALAANIFSLLTPVESLWLNLDPIAHDDGACPQEILRAHLNDSNFYTSIHQCYLDLVVLGTACLFMAESPIGSASAFNFTAVPMGDIAVARNFSDEITAVFHTTYVTAIDIPERWPAFAPTPELLRTIKENPAAPVKMIQAVIKNDKWDYVSWLDAGGDFENNVVAVGDFQTNPYIIFRWSAAAGEPYGRSPAMRALPDIKTANKVVELVLKNAAIAVAGIWQADDDGVINLSNITLTPGAIIPKAVGSSGLVPLKSGADFDVSEIILGDLRTRIKHAMLADRISVLNDKEMTATEVMARNTDMMRILGATYGRIMNELIRPLVGRGLGILSRRGTIRKTSLRTDARLRYTAPISQLAAAEKLNDILAFVNTAAAAGFEDVINRPALAAYLANAMHVPTEIMKN